jgi:DNA-binding transcriptional LysR family regulator
MTKATDRALFLAVADAESFSGAADALGVPISTVSRRIASLEAELNVVLLERTTRHVRLTALGRDYAEQLRPLLLNLDELEAGLAQRDASGSGVIRIAAPVGLDRPFFGPAIARLRAQAPDVEVVWAAVNDAHPIRDGYDVVVTDGRVIDHELVARKLISTRDVCVASPGYLSRRGSPSTPRDLATHDALVLDTSRAPASWPLLRGGTVAVHPALRSDNYSLLLDAARHDVGIALVPELMLVDVPAGELNVVLETSVGAKRDIHIAYARDARRRRVVRTLIDFALDYAKSFAHLSVELARTPE